MADKERRRWRTTVAILIVLLAVVLAVPTFAAQRLGTFWGSPAGDSLVNGPNGSGGPGWGMMGGAGPGGFGGMMAGFGFNAANPLNDPDSLAKATGLPTDRVKDLLTKVASRTVILADAIADLSGGKAQAADVVNAFTSGSRKTLTAIAESYGVDLAKAQTASQETWNVFIGELVKAGEITQAQADQIGLYGFAGGIMGGFGSFGVNAVTPVMYDPDALATATGLTADQVKDLLTKAPPYVIVLADAITDLSGGKATAADVVTALRSGKTLATIARGYGVDLTKAQTAAQATWNAFVSALVKAGKLTQAQADLAWTCPGINANIQGNAGSNVPVVPWSGFGCGRMGRGMMGGWRFQQPRAPAAWGGN